MYDDIGDLIADDDDDVPETSPDENPYDSLQQESRDLPADQPPAVYQQILADVAASASDSVTAVKQRPELAVYLQIIGDRDPLQSKTFLRKNTTIPTEISAKASTL